MSGEVVHKLINENITFQYMDGDENSLWSLLLAIGYIKADQVVKREEYTECDVSVTRAVVADMTLHFIRYMRIFKLGFAFCNKEVMVVEAHV